MSTNDAQNRAGEFNGGWTRARRPDVKTLLVTLGAMLSTTAAVAADVENGSGDYPPLRDLPGADISGESDIVIFLSDGRALVAVDDELRDVGNRPLEIGFDTLTEVTLWFVLSDQDADTTLFMTRDGSWTDTLGFCGTGFHYVVRPSGASAHGFEIADPGQRAPTKPDIVLVPIEDAPDPR